ncbi:hypothetical protein WT21_05815 [Burkholderia territorii]|uniref:Uncharacterized protein n=1 Tax=Burkholderia territorii TaxID=1503055 RepID=A0A6L3NLH9_9BURK|nr:hypothetical protein [Burkholderia territorii]KAB0684011.1 hypothetical protein F7R13_09510 [Burkholderia territorii]KVG54624.1 hypothetical protein WS79_27040 [Burkholderia territorii]KVL40881.1 hypothetical protein WS97_05310 [Burkholderia territorii]KVQ53302.1 hypothetical protein WT21_05815 [Burkholderia territorii]KWA26005.1 hypothetical protein WT39_21875 [Burkholderia territorii]
MPFDHAAECPTDVSCDTVVADTGDVAHDAPAPGRRAARADSRSRRFRFGDALDDVPSRGGTGSIAISFAVVSRRNWPR